ncbi:BON domain-containing protein [Psychrobacter frigidicola]|uniref:BON domain-containing protein n=1 Tax=Psychrobacter frigidicola TaxID=45611 RepID=A0A5C6ZYL0_9GAMM|nr:BON domain-containing protein [Psychrobacter frigidicola]TXD96035.1 BON domain-containing protein [Psychrobacter frigidicola]
MTRMHSLTAIFNLPRRAMMGAIVMVSIVSTGCTTNYLTNSTEGTYGVPVTERTIPQRLLDRSIEHTVKVNIYGLQENLKQDSRISINSFYSEVLLTGEVPSEALKKQIEEVVRSMPDVRRVYNEMDISVAKGYSSTVHDGYITSKLLARVTANNGIKPSQIKTVTNDGVVYVMGRMTPTQQSLLIEIANSTVGITELVLLTTLINDQGAPVTEDDIMFERNATGASVATVKPMIRNAATTDAAHSAEPVLLADNTNLATQETSSPYIELYSN